MGSLIGPSPCESCDKQSYCTLNLNSCSAWLDWYADGWATIREVLLGIEKPPLEPTVKKRQLWRIGRGGKRQ